MTWSFIAVNGLGLRHTVVSGAAVAAEKIYIKTGGNPALQR
jgi:hypothetical protein